MDDESYRCWLLCHGACRCLLRRAADAWRATTSAMALLGVAGEVAAEKTQARGLGVGSMAVYLLDELQLLDQPTFEGRLKLELATW